MIDSTILLIATLRSNALTVHIIHTHKSNYLCRKHKKTKRYKEGIITFRKCLSGGFVHLDLLANYHLSSTG